MENIYTGCTAIDSVCYRDWTRFLRSIRGWDEYEALEEILTAAIYHTKFPHQDTLESLETLVDRYIDTYGEEL